MNPADTTEIAALRTTIERLVREALRAGGGPRKASDDPASPLRESDSHRASSRSLGKPPAVMISDQVVSTEVIHRLPEGTREVEFAARAVITPAAIDQLKQLGIGYRRVAGSRSGAVVAGRLKSSIADADHPERAVGYARQLASRGIAVDAVDSGRLDPKLPVGSVGIVASQQPALQIDHYARVEQVCTAVVDSVDAVRRVAADLQPVIWVIDSHRLSASGIVAVASECLRASLRTPTPRRGNSR